MLHTTWLILSLPVTWIPGQACHDVFIYFSHAIESYTVMPYTNREGQEDPSYRPAYQGNNPISDIWSLHALEVTAKYIKRLEG